jgi:hypothetical protein
VADFRSYTVKSGDSLSKIARDQLGDVARWPEIAKINRLVSPYTILPGQLLTLPDTVTVRATPGAAPSSPEMTPEGAPGTVTLRVKLPPLLKNEPTMFGIPVSYVIIGGILMVVLPAIFGKRRRAA